jgi:hypothetical protein
MFPNVPFFGFGDMHRQGEPRFVRRANHIFGSSLDMDPMAQFFGDFAGQFAESFGAQPEEEHSKPPTAADALRSIPTIKVSARDLQESNECVICLEKLTEGEEALRVPCGHVFHDACIRSWLGNSNQCPTCRYELPTADADFEVGRRERMAKRRLRFTVEDLSARSVRELRYLTQHLNVSITGCLEKYELVDAIVLSGRVEVIPSSVEEREDETFNTEPHVEQPPIAHNCHVNSSTCDQEMENSSYKHRTLKDKLMAKSFAAFRCFKHASGQICEADAGLNEHDDGQVCDGDAVLSVHDDDIAQHVSGR